MRERIAFQAEEWGEDEWGGSVMGYVTKFEEPARLKPGIGSETVIAARLAGRQPYTITVRSSSRTREITPAWRAYDARAGFDTHGAPKRLFEIKAIANPDEWNEYLNIVVEETVR